MGPKKGKNKRKNREVVKEPENLVEQPNLVEDHLKEMDPQTTIEEEPAVEKEHGGEQVGDEEQQTEKEQETEKEQATEKETQSQGDTNTFQPPQPKKHRGPTKMKDIAKDPNTKVRVEFTELGEPCGEGSVKLSSYLGPLVREHVPVLIDDWRKVGDVHKTVLWKSIQARFDLDGEYEKAAVMKQMGCLWRASKSRLVGQILSAKTNADRMKLRPKNIPLAEWRKFVKQKTSEEFKAMSEKYKERRRSQIPHTCSRKGMVRLAEDLKKDSPEPSNVTRLKVWVKSRTKKDGTLVNTDAAEKIRKAAEMAHSEDPSSSSANPKEDLLAQILGPDNPGRLRAMGRGMNMSKFACFQVKNKYMAEMQQNQVHLQQQLHNLQEELVKMKNQRSEFPEVGENSTPRSVNKRLQTKCVLYDWSGSDYKVAEGRILSSEPSDFVNDIPLGPNSVKILVETPLKPDAFLWRPAPNMFTIAEAVGELIAWPQNCAFAFDNGVPVEEVVPKSPDAASINLCKLLNWGTNDEEIVAEGRWMTREPKALVNGLPLGPNAIKVFVDVVKAPDTFLWRPTAELANLEDSLKSFVAWPANRVVFCGIDTDSDSPIEEPVATPQAPIKNSKPSSQSASQSASQSSPQQSTSKDPKENQKCMLMDITGQKRVVAEGRWFTNKPDHVVHFVPLGPKAVCVWVDVVKFPFAKVWRPSSFMDCMEDALGSTVAWPEDKVMVV